MAPAKKNTAQRITHSTCAENRKARHNYFIDDNFEVGLVLTGSEVKSLRTGQANIAESFAEIKNGEAWLINAHIQPFEQGNRYNHEPRRPRKLLLHRKQLNKLQAAVQREGATLVPLRLYFNDDGRAKLDLGLARGKKMHDKRQTEKDRDWAKQKARFMKENR